VNIIYEVHAVCPLIKSVRRHIVEPEFKRLPISTIHPSNQHLSKQKSIDCNKIGRGKDLANIQNMKLLHSFSYDIDVCAYACVCVLFNSST